MVKKSKVLQPTWANEPSVDDLKFDYISSTSGQEVYKATLRTYKVTLEGGVVRDKFKYKSHVRSLLVREHVEWKIPALSEPILSTRNLFKISPVGGEDVAAAKQTSLLLNSIWNTKINKVKVIDDIVRTLVQEGTCIVKTGWETIEGVKEVEVEKPVYADEQILSQMVQQGQISPEQAQQVLLSGEQLQVGTEIVYEEQDTLIKNQPTYEVCINSNVTVDPTCNGVMEDAQFVIHEYETSYSELKQDEYSKNSKTGEEQGFYHNVEDVLNSTDRGELYDEFISPESNNFEFKDKARRRLRAYEYWGYWDIQGDGILVAIVATWINTTLVRLEENPFPHGRVPFSICQYMPIQNSIFGEPDAALLKESQDIIGGMYRAIQDTVAEEAIGQKFINQNLMGPAQRNAYEKGQTVYYQGNMDPKTAIWKNTVQPLNSTPFDVINLHSENASRLSGSKGFAGSQGGGKLTPTSQQRDSMDATAKRDLSILRRICSGILSDVGRMTIANLREFMSEEEVVRNTGDEFVTITRDDMEGEVDLSVEVSTPEKDEHTIEKLSFLMQTFGPNGDPKITNMFLSDIAELSGLPARADVIRNYEPPVPPPNPIEEQLGLLQIEKQKLDNDLVRKQMENYDSLMQERKTRAEENISADIELKKAKAKKEEASTIKIESETDILDASFILEQSGQKREQDLEDRELDAIYSEREQDVVDAVSKAATNVVKEI